MIPVCAFHISVPGCEHVSELWHAVRRAEETAWRNPPWQVSVQLSLGLGRTGMLAKQEAL